MHVHTCSSYGVGITWSDLVLHLRLDHLLQFGVDGGGEGLGDGGDELVLSLAVQGLLVLENTIHPLLYVWTTVKGNGHYSTNLTSPGPLGDWP